MNDPKQIADELRGKHNFKAVAIFAISSDGNRIHKWGSHKDSEAAEELLSEISFNMLEYQKEVQPDAEI